MDLLIVQGSNEPIRFIFEDETPGTFTEVSVGLYSAPHCPMKGKLLKHWAKANCTVDGNELRAPLTETETLAFDAGPCIIELKWTRLDGTIGIAESVIGEIGKRNDHTQIGG